MGVLDLELVRVRQMLVQIDSEKPTAMYVLAGLGTPGVGSTHGDIGIARLELGEANSLWIGTLHVSAGYRSQGLGWKLLEYIEEYARESGRRWLSLAVKDTNEGAKRLYQKFGFEDYAEGQEGYRQYLKQLPAKAPVEV